MIFSFFFIITQTQKYNKSTSFPYFLISYLYLSIL